MPLMRARGESGRGTFVALLALGVAAASVGCSSSGAARDAAGTRDTGTGPHDAGADARDATSGTHDARDAATTEAGACLALGPVKPPYDSSRCAVTAQTIDPASLCPGTASCPVTAYYQLTASGESDYAGVAPVGTNGGSVLLYATMSTTAFTCLYTMFASAAPQAQEFLDLVDNASPALLTSAGGGRALLPNQSNLDWLQEMPSAWFLYGAEPVVRNLSFTALLGRPNGDLFVTYLDTQAEHGGLARLSNGCAQVTTLPGPAKIFYGLDVDTAGNPWVAGTSVDPITSVTSLEVVGPDGTAYHPAPTVGPDTPQEPIVLAGGVSGTAKLPTLVTQDYYGVHLVEANGATPVWADRVIPGSPAANEVNGCPPEQQQTPAGGCGSIPATCNTQLDGPVAGYAAARTASGKTFVVWAAVKKGTAEFAVTCASAAQGALCECTNAETSSQGSGALIIARVDTASPAVVLQLAYPTSVEVGAYELSMVARGDTLLLAANEGLPTGSGTDLLYFEIDTTGL
jgi:hypothetical protein